MIVLLDFDDTLSEYSRFNLRYIETMATLLTNEFGGSHDIWFSSTAKMALAIEADYSARFVGQPLNGYNRWREHANHLAAIMLFEWAGFLPPPDSVHAVRSLHETAVAASTALFPGMAETVNTIHRAGIPLCMASGNDSRHINLAISRQEIARCFSRLYGPDLVNCAKEGPEYYSLIASDQQVEPRDFLVVDNDPIALEWAQASGMNVLHVHLLPAPPGRRDMFDLPTITDANSIGQIILELSRTDP